MPKPKINNTTLIKNFILEAKEALSHVEIEQGIGKKCNRVTVYRILDKLIEQGVIHKIVDINGISKYASCEKTCSDEAHQHEHLHFSCTECNSVTCLSNVALQFTLPKEYLVKESHFILSGICPNCR